MQILCTGSKKRGGTIHMDTSDFVAPHTSPILRDYSSNGCIVDEKNNYSPTMLN